jgi:glycine/D-amino acid oxidase-like deaminating enzyme
LEKAVDVVVVGGGIAGVLAAARLAAAGGGRRIALLEKDAVLGGRLRSTSADASVHGYGLNAISAELAAFAASFVTTPPSEGEEAAPPASLEQLGLRRLAKFGVLAGNRLITQDISQWFGARGARVLGGLTAQKQWAELEELWKPAKAAAATTSEGDDEEDEGEDARGKAFGQVWKGSRKQPAAVVLDHYGAAIGVPDVWTAAVEALAERAGAAMGARFGGDFDGLIAAITRSPAFTAAVEVATACRAVDADRDADGDWTVRTECGTFTAPKLIVAQSPWQAAAWLKRSFWPPHVISIASKTKPVSVVVMAETVPEAAVGLAEALPEVTLVPSERVQILRYGAREVTLQATIDFELSLQAPAVVKAVKALKRARKKLLATYPGVTTETDHIALVTFAWAQAPTHAERRWVERLGRKPSFGEGVAFCGDAYGAAYDFDANVVRSVTAATDWAQREGEAPRKAKERAGATATGEEDAATPSAGDGGDASAEPRI